MYHVHHLFQFQLQFLNQVVAHQLLKRILLQLRGQHSKYEDLRTSKGKQWKSSVSKPAGRKSKSHRKENNVSISIGLYQWNPKEGRVKAKGGKRMVLVVLGTDCMPVCARRLLDNGRIFTVIVLMRKISCYCWKIVNKHYSFLTLINIFFAHEVPYREQLGKDYNKITMYLCARSHYQRTLLSQAP